jgi:porphobilinogen synthase
MGGLSLRRTRLAPAIRELTREVAVERAKLIQPLFVAQGPDERQPVPGLTNVWRDTPRSLPAQIEADLRAGITKFLLFAVPAEKRDRGFDHAFAAGEIAAIRKRFGADLWLAADVCLCSYTTHGHCGVLNDAWDHVNNAATVEGLAAAAALFAQAGADCVAPSDMMDGRVAAIRAALDASGCERTLIMSYAAKFHSAFYGPFRVAANSAPAAGAPLQDRATYQIDPARPKDALAAALRDAAEGADILMVKPGLPYLDVLRNLSQRIAKPWAAYQTSGEQAALDLAAEKGLLDGSRAQLEAWTAFRRAGADMIISYAARRAMETCDFGTVTESGELGTATRTLVAAR